MIKLMSILKKKSGMSREEFIAYYEKHHVPLALRTIPMGHDYLRNYLLPNANELGNAVDFDVITEMKFNNPEELQAMMTAFNEPGVRKILGEDEANFLDPDQRAFLVEEYSTKNPSSS